jgi:septum formation protein
MAPLNLILASASPRRVELLKRAGYAFSTIPANVDETPDTSLSPEQWVEALAHKKAAHIWAGLAEKNAGTVVLGADTTVVIDGMILEKPKDAADAFAMLTRLQGRRHTVHTGVALVGFTKTVRFTESTDVFFRPLTAAEIDAYITTEEPFGKAGAYGIQEKGALLVKRVEGDFYTIMGLPLCRLHMTLQSWTS